VLIDMTDLIRSRLVFVILGIVGVAVLLLLIVFRSVAVAAIAAIVNVASIGAAYGVVVMVFQWGWGQALVGLSETVPVAPFIPVMMFAILFGLSMDYQVFLLSRVREEHLTTGDARLAVSTGLARTARVITSAALIMMSVFLAFVTNPGAIIKMIGFGMAVAVLVDASIVQGLVPALLHLLGKRGWWMPRWLDRVLPHLDIEGAPAEPPAAKPVPS
jgi:RND superfamily putative drug exporter